MNRKVFLAFLTLIVAVSSSTAQEVTGNLQGRILDPESKPVQFVQVIVSGPDLQGNREALTLSDGYFYFLALPVGSYAVQVVHVTYQLVTLKNVYVGLGKTTDIGVIRLSERVYETEEVTVSGKAPLLDPVSTVIGANLVSDEYEELPIDRDYRNMVTLLPQVNESFLGDDVGFAGGTGMENKYYIDGADGTESVSGLSSTRLPYNFIREIQVRSGGYQAEYRGTLGGVVEVVTHSGGNEVHGQVFGFYLNDRLTAAPRVTVNDPFTGSYAMYDVGFSMGGPIKRDQLHYYLAYNPTFSDEQAEIPGQGIHDYDGASHRFATKLTWRIDQKNDLELSVYGDPTKFEGATPVSFGQPPTALENPDPMLMKIREGGVYASVNGRHLVRDNLLLQSRISLVSRNNSQLPLTPRGADPLFIDEVANTWSDGILYQIETDALVATFGVNGTVLLGDHMIKSGLEYKNVDVDYRDSGHVVMYFASDEYIYLTLSTDGPIRNRLPSAFVQDSWRIWDRLTLNAGIRWDGQYIIGSDDKVAVRFTDQWQPRAGFTFKADKNGKHQVFGSYGRFYQELSMAAPALHFIYGSTYRVVAYDHDPRIDPGIGPGDQILDDVVSTPHGELKGLEGQHFDEFTLGYEQQLTPHSKATVRGVYRAVGNGLEDVKLSTGEWVWGNPGYGELSEFPKMKREYTALEFTYQRLGGKRFNLLASYTLSRNRGNYNGIFDLDSGGDGWTNAMPAFDLLESLENSDGLLPNDRTHSFKFSGSYRVGYGMTMGATALWQSGTPLNELGTALEDPVYSVFVLPRGEAGRMNSIWDLSLRMSYDVSHWWSTSVHPKILLDFLHIGSPKEPVNYIQRRYLERDIDGNHITENPLYGQPIAFQPPFAVRMGLTVDF